MSFFDDSTLNKAAMIAKRFMSAKRVLLMCHERPDGDTLGGAFALQEALRQKGVIADVSTAGEVKGRYASLGKPAAPEGEYDVIAAIDVASPDMLAYAADYAKKIDIIIDHHPTGGGFAKEIELLEPRAAAAAELVFLVIKELHAELNENICRCIYTAITSDTGCFRYSNTEQFTHELAGEILSTGFDGSEIARLLFETRSIASLRLEQRVFSDAAFECGGAIAVAVVSESIKKELGVNDDDLDGLSGFLRSIEGVEASALIKENGKGFRVSMRSNKIVDVSEVCAKFGGGGHKRAAGCNIHGEPLQVKESIMNALCEAYKKI